MPLGPMDEFLAHQTCETFDHVFTSDRNFYDRYYFNMYSKQGDLFLITGMGQYPNLGPTDAFVSLSYRQPFNLPDLLFACRTFDQNGPLNAFF